MKKLFMTSALCVCMALPAYADIASDAESASCDNTTIGATEGSTGLEAQWSANQYSESAGQYLLFENNTVSQHQTCTAGNYCPGFTNQTFADSTMGLNSCATNDSNFPNSDAGASAATQCYRACNIDNMGTESGKTIAPIAHATAISGNDYYGAGTDTCVPTACDPGYSVDDGVGPLAPYIDTGAASQRSNKLSGGDATDLNDGEWEATWSDGTVVKGTSTCNTIAGTNPWNGSTYTLISGNIHASSEFTAGNYGDNNSGKGNCYCMMESYKLSNSSTQTIASPSWVFFINYGSGGNCDNMCAGYCGIRVQNNPGFRSAIFGDLGYSAPSCQANIIDITWYKNNGEANVVNQCTYGESVTIPETPTKPGYIFGGWRIKSN